MRGNAGAYLQPRPGAGPARALGGGTGTVNNTSFLVAHSPGPGGSAGPYPPFQPQEKPMAGDWPLHDLIEFGALAGAVPCARLRARLVLWEWGLGGLGETVELAVSELMSNAVTASRTLEGGPFPVGCWLLSDGKCVLVLVWDACPDPPVRLHPDGDTEGGRGLMLVEALSTRWGFYPYRWNGAEGKAVWALISAEE
jgi:Histidine kinase-like ATPase domain